MKEKEGKECNKFDIGRVWTVIGVDRSVGVCSIARTFLMQASTERLMNEEENNKRRNMNKTMMENKNKKEMDRVEQTI